MRTIASTLWHLAWIIPILFDLRMTALALALAVLLTYIKTKKLDSMIDDTIAMQDSERKHELLRDLVRARNFWNYLTFMKARDAGDPQDSKRL